MEIAGLVSTEQLFELDLEHPATCALLGIKVMIRSAGADAAVEVVRKQTDDILAKQQKRKLIAADTVEQNELDQAVSYIASWDWGSNTYDKVKPDNDPATFKAILKKEPWIYAQVVGAARDIANFTRS